MLGDPCDLLQGSFNFAASEPIFLGIYDDIGHELFKFNLIKFASVYYASEFQHTSNL